MTKCLPARFEPGSILHLLVLIALALTTAVLVRCGRSTRAEEKGQAFDRRLAVVLAFIWVALLVENLLPGRFRWDQSLPLHVCDVVGAIAVFAMWNDHRLSRAVLHFWGLGLSSQAFVTPMVYKGPASIDFWTFWVCHISIVSVALYDMLGRSFRPTWIDWRRVGLFSGAYILLVTPVNIRLGVNYGYLGHTNFAQPSTMLLLGSWPGRLPAVLLLVLTATAGMTVSFRLRKRPNAVSATRNQQPQIRHEQLRFPYMPASPARAA